jgi:hypothetical protein
VKTATRIAALAGLTLLGLLGWLSPAQAGLKLYSGSLQFHAFGNTVIFTRYTPTSTGGDPLPSFTRSSFYAIPIGHFCNYQNLTHFVSMGSVHTGTRFISTAYPAPRSTQAMNCATATKQQGAPITGSGTATTFTTPLAPSRPAIRLRGGAVYDSVSGSRGYDVPYVYWVTHAALGTGPGTVFPGGGPGRTYISRGGTGGTYTSTGGTGRASGFAGIYPRPGGPQFGGTMRLLGQVRSTGFLFSGIGDGMFGASIDWGFEHAGASARGYDCWVAAGTSPAPGACPSVATNQWTWTDGYRNRAYHTTGLPLMGTTMVYVDALAWTTGLAVVSGVRGAYPTIIARNGYDNRTSMGSGAIQLVSPHLVNWIGLDCPTPGCSLRSETTAGIAILRLQFIPEPQAWMMLVTGAALLPLLYRRRTRGLRLRLPLPPS